MPIESFCFFFLFLAAELGANAADLAVIITGYLLVEIKKCVADDVAYPIL
jgi:hypothetical protein